MFACESCLDHLNRSKMFSLALVGSAGALVLWGTRSTYPMEHVRMEVLNGVLFVGCCCVGSGYSASQCVKCGNM